MFAPGRIVGTIVALALVSSCNLNAFGELMVRTVDDINANTPNNDIDVAPGDTFTMDIIISDDGNPAIPFGFFFSASTTAQLMGVTPGVAFTNPQPTMLFGGMQGGAFGADPDYLFFNDTFGPLVTVSPLTDVTYANDTAEVSDFSASFSNYDISGQTKLLARLEMKVSDFATVGETYDLIPSVFLADVSDPFFTPIFPDFTGATIHVVPVPEPASVIGWALIGVTMCGVVWWRRSRASAEVAKHDQLGST